MNEEKTGKCLRQVEHIRGHLCFILYTQEDTFLIIFNLYIYMTTFFVSVVDSHEARLCVDLLCSFDKSVECPTIT